MSRPADSDVASPHRAGTISRAVQPAVRDVMDASCRHSWLNPPLATGGLPGDIYKARPAPSRAPRNRMCMSPARAARSRWEFRSRGCLWGRAA